MRTIRTGLGATCAALALSSSALATIPGTPGGGTSSSTGAPLDCSAAVASKPEIWPPDHQYYPEIILGVTGPTSITVLVTGIEQDEPVATPGSGHTSPDGTGVGTATAMVRAERAGPGTGRIYFITFSATSGGEQCTGTVPVYVPHDQGQGLVPVDTGNRYDSTQSDF